MNISNHAFIRSATRYAVLDPRYWILDSGWWIWISSIKDPVSSISPEPEKTPLAKPVYAGDNRLVDVGNLILGIRFIKAKSMKRGSSSSRSDWLSKTGCFLRPFYFRHDEVEFPMASQTDCNLWTFRDWRAADRVRSQRTLHRLNNLITKDQHELAIHTGDASAMGAVALDEGADAVVFKINANARKLRSRKHFGNASSRFSVGTTAAKRSRRRNRVTVNSNLNLNASRNSANANRGRSGNRNRSK